MMPPNYSMMMQGQMFPPAAPFIQAQPPRQIELMHERNLFGFEMRDNEIPLPPTVCNPNVYCDPSVFRCTFSMMPATNELLSKTGMPLALTLQPFRDLKSLTVLQTNIVRCRFCRAYINPYVTLTDNRHWKCNLCYRTNEMPEEFIWDPATKTFGDPMKRPELQNSTIELIAPSEYMLRSPQPPLYLFIFDVSSNAVDCGYLHTFGDQLLACLDQLPGDEHILIGFIGMDSSLHFFQFFDVDCGPKQFIVCDVEEAFLPVDYGLVVELHQFKNSIQNFLLSLPTLYESNSNASCCLGSALVFAQSLIASTGGRVTVLLASNPNTGLGAVDALPGNSTSKLGEFKETVENLIIGSTSKKVPSSTFAPSTDFYKRIALECTAKQIAIDIFVIGDKPINIATISEAPRFTGGTLFYFCDYHFVRNETEVLRFQKYLRRYLTRRLGFEAVLRIRCARGLSLHTFFGNFFVRSTDLLAMPNVNPDSTIGVQVEIVESQSDQQTVCFQAALLYTSSKGDRRIRVHNLCLPVISTFSRMFEIIDVKATVSILAKMGAERAATGSDLQDCRGALIASAASILAAYNRSIGQRPLSILVPEKGQLKFLPLFILGLLKSCGFSSAGVRQNKNGIGLQISSMLLLKNAPLEMVLLEICPALYAVHAIDQSDEFPVRLPLSYEQIARDGLYLLDTGSYVYLYVCRELKQSFLEGIFGVNNFTKIDEDEPLKLLDSMLSDRLHFFLQHLSSLRGSGTFSPALILREDGIRRELFTRRLIEDRSEASHSYVEFLQFLQQQMKKD